MTKETLIKSALRALVNGEVKQGSAGYALEEDSAYEVSWKDVLEWLEQQPSETAHGSTYGGVSWGGTYTPKEQQSCEDMRDATKEERKSTKDYIDSISKPTGLRFDDIYEEIDFVQPHKKVPCMITIGKPCEDCVSRNELNEAISELTYWHPTIDGRLEVGGAFDNTVYKVEDVWRLAIVLPPVTPSRPKGKWIKLYKGDTNETCSKCEFEARRKYNFCPNCGAKMEVDE